MSHRPAPPAALWRRADLLVLAAAVAGGLLLLGAGYWGVSGTRHLDDQVASARLAAAGVLVAQVGFVWAVVCGRRALGHRLRAALPGRAGAAGPSDSPSLSSALVATPDMTRYHRDRCSFVAGKAVAAATAAAHQSAGRRPCGVCRP